MTRKQLEDARRLYNAMERAGFTADETDALRRIERTLHFWAEAECNGEIERDGPDADGKPFRSFPNANKHIVYAIPDRERGALKRLAGIMLKHPNYQAYVQGDPRGCGLYVVKTSDVPVGADIGSYYTRGIAICY